MADRYEDHIAPWFEWVQDGPRKRYTIEQLEAILMREDDVAIEILPNGEIRERGEGEREIGRKPLTMRENLGGEYATA
jgi:hypothetical protein